MASFSMPSTNQIIMTLVVAIAFLYLGAQMLTQGQCKSTDLATSLLDKRLDTMNEFRQALKDQQATFVSRSEFEILHQRIIEDIRILREAKATTEGKASMASVYISYLIALIALAISIIRIFI